MNDKTGTEALISALAELRKSKSLWMEGYEPDPDNECDKKPLSDEGKKVVKSLVRTCISHDIAPYCSIGGRDGRRAIDDIISIGSAECDDLVAKTRQSVGLQE